MERVRLGKGRKERDGQDVSAQGKHILIRKGQGKYSPENTSPSLERLNEKRGA